MGRSILLMTLVLASCTQEPETAIVRRVREAGAGDVRVASNEAILDWFRKHQEVSQEVRKLCEPIRKDAPASWADTAEGRVCGAALKAAAFQFTPKPSDGQVFVPGK